MGTLSYQWFTEGQAIAGASQSSFTITQAQLGKALSVVASYTDGGGTLESVTSNAPVQVVNYNTTAAEKTTTVTTVVPASALLGTAPKYTLTGADAWLFKISTKGALTFATAKDYEQPVDANKDGIYEVSVTMTNAKTGYKVVKDLTVGVEFTPINGTAAADTLKGTAGYDTLDGLAGDDKLTGGAGLDTFLVSSGRDAVLDFNALTKGATGAEILQVSAGATADATLKAAWTATADSFNLGTANILTSGMAVDLSAVSQGQGWKVTNAGATTTITGSRFNDVLTGGSDADLLNGGAGNDLLSGGKGADILTGGTGADTCRLSGDTKTDHITDFVSGTDHLTLDSLLFKALPKGNLGAEQWVLGTKALTTSQHLIYDAANGALYYDADGSGKGAAVLIAVLDNHAAMTYQDLAVI
jgi:Ca2+-binding RTX toxin-like protein